MRVLNKRNLRRRLNVNEVYVGRPSKFGNRFSIGKHGTRAEVIELYRIQQLPQVSEPMLAELRGKDLVCWCSPQPCHADLLLEAANTVAARRLLAAFFLYLQETKTAEQPARTEAGRFWLAISAKQIDGPALSDKALQSSVENTFTPEH